MNRQSEDDAWRAIVENYGERVEVDTPPSPDLDPRPAPQAPPPSATPSAPPSSPQPAPESAPEPDPGAGVGPEAAPQDLVAAGPGDFPAEGTDDDAEHGAGDMLESGYADDDSFVPPPPPPLPHVPLPRLVSWVGLLGSPTLLLLCLIAGISLPQWLSYLMVVGFVGGFAYLVVHMPRQRQDPWDDGAVL